MVVPRRSVSVVRPVTVFPVAVQFVLFMSVRSPLMVLLVMATLPPPWQVTLPLTLLSLSFT